MRYFLILCALFMVTPTYAKKSVSCDYYVNKASQLQCAADHYLLRFGYKYCQEFLTAEANFSQQGRESLKYIRRCLIQSLKAVPDLSCSNVEPIALDSHYFCYIEAGYCSFSWADKMALFNIIGHELVNPIYGIVAWDLEKYCLWD